MEGIVSRIGSLLGMRLHNATGTVRSVPSGNEEVPKRRKNTRKRPDNMKLKESIDQVVEMRASKLTYREIGEKLGISKQRVYQILSEQKRIETERNEWSYGLSVRNRSILRTLKIESREQAIEAIKEKRIKPLLFKNYGYRSFSELCQWLGIDCDIKVSKLCPHCGKSLK